MRGLGGAPCNSRRRLIAVAAVQAGRRADARGMMLTVQRVNHSARQFYVHQLGFTHSPVSPSFCKPAEAGGDEFDYELLQHIWDDPETTDRAPLYARAHASLRQRSGGAAAPLRIASDDAAPDADEDKPAGGGEIVGAEADGDASDAEVEEID